MRDFDIALHIVFTDQAAHDAYQLAQRHHDFINENKQNWGLVRVFRQRASQRQRGAGAFGGGEQYRVMPRRHFAQALEVRGLGRVGGGSWHQSSRRRLAAVACDRLASGLQFLLNT